jgi:hypothetical protein
LKAISFARDENCRLEENHDHCHAFDGEARYYKEALQEGRVLVMVRAAERYPEAMGILHRRDGKYMAAF